MASKELVRLAWKAAELSAKAGTANRAWRDAFAREYGHKNISGALVEVVDYSTGNVGLITAAFIDKHSKPDAA